MPVSLAKHTTIGRHRLDTLLRNGTHTQLHIAGTAMLRAATHAHNTGRPAYGATADVIGRAIDAIDDAHSNMHAARYAPAWDVADCDICGDPIDYCPGHGTL